MPTKRDESKKAETVNKRIRNSRRGKGDEACEWSMADGGLLQQVIDVVASLGFAIQFGLTRDQQTFVVRIVGDGEPFNEYVRPTEDIDVYLRGLLSDYEAAKNGK
jgi:hypothetical protein